ncbi:hypothetical protein SteCoe_3031 [Stentor coeruleus]|uniref:Uncharacterized protein n=1 Tax=Stentor coeruleus TaxID=5963 RepID=A0A1R2CY75_9CILI|nr:hypothetical protein SteCoe_3031 [Stentor coeruleus]
MIIFTALRKFARNIKPIAHPTLKKKLTLDDIKSNHSFLQSIGIKYFPINPNENLEGKVEVYDESGDFIWENTYEYTKSFASKEKLDILFVSNNPPMVQLSNYTSLIMKSIRLAQNKQARDTMKKVFRSMNFRNTIKAHDIKLKMQKVEELMKKSMKIIIIIESKQKNLAELEKSRLIAYDLTKLIKDINPSYKFDLEEADNNVIIKLSPDSERENMLNAIAADASIFESGDAQREYKRLHKNLEYYKYTQGDNLLNDDEDDVSDESNFDKYNSDESNFDKYNSDESSSDDSDYKANDKD